MREDNISEHKILFLINDLKVGGAENVFIRDANALNERGFQIYFAILFGNEDSQILLEKLKLPKERVFFARGGSLFDLNAWRRLSAFARKAGIKTVYSTLNEANIVGRTLKISNPSVRTIIREANVADIKPWKFKVIDILLYPFTHTIVAVSHGVKDSLRYLPQGKMEVLENGVSLPAQPVILRESVDILEALFVGSLTPKKNIGFLLKGFSVLKQRGYNFRLRIIGEGVERVNIENLVVELGMQDSVKLLGKLPSEKVAEYYRESDVFVLPSKYEGSPNVLLEAMSHGLPIVTSNFPGADSVIENEKNGLIVKLGDEGGLADAVERYIKNPSEKINIAKAGRKLVEEKYSVEAHMKKLINILELDK